MIPGGFFFFFGGGFWPPPPPRCGRNFTRHPLNRQLSVFEKTIVGPFNGHEDRGAQRWCPEFFKKLEKLPLDA